MAPSLHDTLEEALALLPAALDEPFSGHPLGHLLVRDAPAAIAQGVTHPAYKLQGSPGRGRWAETVWVAVFDRLVTSSAMRGYYLVYLLRKDGAGVYLSLDQGATAVHQEVGGRRYLGVLQDRATVYAGLIREQDLDGLQLGPIDLEGRTMMTRGYQAGNVAARYYETGALPADAELHQDLRRLLALYRRLVEANDHLTDADTPSVNDDGNGEESNDGEAGSGVEARRLRWHLRAERNPTLVQATKRVHGSTSRSVRVQVPRPLRRARRGLHRGASPHTLRGPRRSANTARSSP